MSATVSSPRHVLEALGICIKWRKGHCANPDWIYFSFYKWLVESVKNEIDYKINVKARWTIIILKSVLKLVFSQVTTQAADVYRVSSNGKVAKYERHINMMKGVHEIRSHFWA